MPGPFLNVVPMRAHIDPDRRFTELLAEVRRTVLDGLQHQAYPVERLVERLGLPRVPGRTPLFDVMLAFQNLDPDVRDAGGAPARSLQVDTGRGQYDLEVYASPADGGLELRLDFATALFERSTAERFARRLLAALRSVGADPDLPLHAVDILDPEERAALSAGWNRRELDLPAGQTVLSRIESHRGRSADDTALVCGAERRSYRELDAGAERVAGLLRARGVAREELVGILLERGPLLAEAILGVWKAGCAYVPIEPGYPAARVLGMLADAGCRRMLTVDRLVGPQVRAGFGGQLVDLSGGPDREPVPGQVPPGTPAGPDDLAYALFTSGSTGRPKGALVEQRGMLNHMLAKAVDLGLDHRTVLAQTASHCFDISVWQFFGALVVGGRVVVYPDEVAADPRALLSALRRDAVTVLETVPSILEVMVGLAERDAAALAALAGLRVLLVTGEAVQKPLLDRWFRLVPGVPVLNAYGPTEASDDVTHHLMSSSPPGLTVPIGRPVPNARLYVLDDSVPLGPTALLPTGVKGEICVAGVCVGRGYVDDPVRTAAAFFEDPFVGGRLYRTGDVGRWLPDGTLEFAGRLDHQVKVRGHRIELGEIEAVLAACPGVTANVVVVTGETLVGYVVPDSSAPADVAVRVADHLAGHLPAYAVPRDVVVLDALPLTANGKVDRAALPPPRPGAGAGKPLVGEVEHRIAGLFGEVLGVEVTDADTDFFALGGHSLSAVVLLASAYEQLGVQLPLAAVLQRPTVRGLALAVERARRIGAAPVEQPMTRLSPGDEGEALFLFPPIAGWGMVYLPFAEASPAVTVHAFDFVESDDRVGVCADLVEQVQPHGPLQLGGYSAGGNLAFEVTVELESRGRAVDRLVLFDVMHRDRAEHVPDRAVRDRVLADMDEGVRHLDPQLQAVLSGEAIRERAVRKRAAYVSYWDGLVHSSRVAADILLIRAEDAESGSEWEQAWRGATSGTVSVVRGHGRHAEMMAGPYAAANARLVARPPQRSSP